MNNKVVCDECNKKFEIEVKTRKLPLGIVETYFVCPHCKTKYVSFYTDESIREKQKKINKMWEEYRKLKNSDEVANMFNKIKKFQAEIKSDMEKLKSRMLGTQ